MACLLTASLLVACGDSTSVAIPSADATADAADATAPQDAAGDAAPDLTLHDAPNDTANDTPRDVTADTAADTTADTTPRDVPLDVATDAAHDVAPDFATDAAPDVAVDVATDTVPFCPTGQRVCVGRCVDVQVDRSNCGECGRTCAMGEICAAGACVLSCPAGQTPCDGLCRTLPSDASNCGVCGRVCSLANATTACAAGVCAIAACTVGFADCDAAAASGCETDTRMADANCGACGRTCPDGQACRASACVSTLPVSCLEVLRADPRAASGRYSVDPDGTGAIAPFGAYCNMTDDGGGWALVGQTGEGAPASARGDFRSDRNLAALASGAAPTAGEFSTLDLARFNAFGNRWTVRVVVDTANDGRMLQYTYFRPRAGATISTGIAGSNWLGTSTSAAVEYLTRSWSVGQSNRTWLPVQGFDPTTATVALFCYRLASSGGACLDPMGENQLCHAPAGGVTNELGLTGTYTAAFSNADGVAHGWGRRGTYWLRDSICPPELGDCDGNASNGCEASLRADALHCSACGRACVAGTTCIDSACRRPYPRNCLEQRRADPTSASGTFTIDPDGTGGVAPFLAYCDMTGDDGGWTLLGAGTWYNGFAAQVTAPGGANVLLADAARDALLASTARLFRLGSGAQRLFIEDSMPEFGPATAGGGRHYWRTNAASVRCGTAYAQVMGSTLVTTSTRSVTCDPRAVGSHTCGITAGWILWHGLDTFNVSGAHPCAFGTGASPTSGSLGDLWVR